MTNEQSLAKCDPRFRERLLAVMVAMRLRGWQPVAMTWRSLEQQTELYRSGASHVPFSFHCAVDAEGHPAALAADLTDTRWKTFTHEQRATFFRHLGELAKANGLVWGGDWKRSNAVYAAAPYFMGWDPVHVQLLPNSSLDSVRDRTLAVLRAAAPAAAGGAVLMFGVLGLAGLFVAMRR